MYTVPLYEDLCGGVMKCFAVEVFYQTQARLHPNLRRTLQQILFQSSALNTSTAPSLLTSPPSAPSSPTDPSANGSIALRDVNVSAWVQKVSNESQKGRNRQEVNSLAQTVAMHCGRPEMMSVHALTDTGMSIYKHKAAQGCGTEWRTNVCNGYYAIVCVCVCVCARARVCVRIRILVAIR